VGPIGFRLDVNDQIYFNAKFTAWVRRLFDFASAKVASGLTCRSAQLMTVQELVAMEQGISLVPEMASKGDRSKLVRYRSISGVKPERTLAMIWHKHRYESPLVKGLIEIVRREAVRNAG
jgi:DNA-binding transcriptional LysR family regulator